MAAERSGSNAASLPTQSCSLSHPTQLDPPVIKLTRGTSCVFCQQRKVRCDKNKPCMNCQKAGVECRVVPPAPPRRRKKRLQEKDLLERLRKYERLLNEHGIEFDAIGQDSRLDDVEELGDDFEGLRTSAEASPPPSSATRPDEPAGSLLSLHKEFRASEQLLHDSSEDEIGGSSIHRAFDRMFSHDHGFPLIVGGREKAVTNAHPTTVNIFRLWQIYIDNINSLLKITHTPTIQSQIVEATAQLDKTPRNLEALMFGVYIMAILSLQDSDVEMMLCEPKQELLQRYFAALEQALLNAGFMRICDFISLQAFVLYLHAVRWFVDPRQVFCLLGIAVRIAQRMGLHQDPGGLGMAPFEMEQRRRLWWTLVGYDRRIGEMSGSTVSALSSGGNCRMPLNVNDSDLHSDGKEMPVSHSGPTEMLFALTRIEIAMAVASNSNRDSLKVGFPGKASGTLQGTSVRASAPTIRIAGQDSPAYTLDGFCAHMEGTYLIHCDVQIPLHFFTLTMTRQTMCKMRIIAFLVRMHSAEAMPLKELERESLFLQATQMIEYDNVVQSSESLQSFRWYAMHHFPFPAYMFLVRELRERVSGPMVERAWEAIAANYHLRGLLNNLHSPMHTAFSRLFMKAWNTYEAAEVAKGKRVNIPRFIIALRELGEKDEKGRPHEAQAADVKTGAAGFERSREPRPTTTVDDGASSMMTPPAFDQVMADNGGMGRDDGMGDMDWTYLVSNLQDAGSLQSFGGPGQFGGPMGGTGGSEGGRAG